MKRILSSLLALASTSALASEGAPVTFGTVDFAFAPSEATQHLGQHFALDGRILDGSTLSRSYDAQVDATSEDPDPLPLKLEQKLRMESVDSSQCPRNHCLKLSVSFGTPVFVNGRAAAHKHEFAWTVDPNAFPEKTSLGRIEITDLKGRKLPVEVFLRLRHHEINLEGIEHRHPIIPSFRWKSFWVPQHVYDEALANYVSTYDGPALFEALRAKDQSLDFFSDLGVATTGLYSSEIYSTLRKELSDGAFYQPSQPGREVFLGMRGLFELTLGGNDEIFDLALRHENRVLYAERHFEPITFATQTSVPKTGNLNKISFVGAQSFLTPANLSGNYVRADFVHAELKK